MLLAASLAVLSLLDQIVQASHSEPPIFQVVTLLQTAEALPANKDYGGKRREFIEHALRAVGAVRDERSRYVFQTRAASLLKASDGEEARRLCRQIPAAFAARCWEEVDPEEGKEVAAALAKDNQKETPKPEPAKPKKREEAPAWITEKMERGDREDTPVTEKSLLYREVLAATDEIPDTQDRMYHEAYLAAWFAENREEATAALAAAKLQKSFSEVCRCEDTQCDSLEGRSECSDNIDDFISYLGEKDIDPAVLAIRHPSVATRALIYKLKTALGKKPKFFPFQ